ncbi:murein biosynthesis integral membrane protein MurJ [Actinopolymorpha alba]|uniref:murein biosynthesis integral membrane protein MurJ n=1 Tax=Actinopolymorpha alba TaxID=533267 RepID=UPI00035CB390|nr:lipid II flippase MurJ [Actinopolymorpha alba]
MTTAQERRRVRLASLGAGLAGAAVLVGVITMAARLVGFGRWLVFSKTVGDTCLGDAYNTANQLPNVLFEIVAGGALASVVVPVLAGAYARGDEHGRAEASRTMSALFTWTLLALTPVTLLAALLAAPYARLMLAGQPGCPDGTSELAARMLLVFVPQIWCYGVAVVASGTLQAQRRFVAAAVAPLASSLVVVAAYAVFALLAEGILDVDQVPGSAVAVLAGGTTLGVLALALTVLVPLLRKGGGSFRPTLRFPPGVGQRVRGLATAGIVALIAQQVVALVLTWLANHRGDAGTLTMYTWSFAVFALPYAVLAVPIVTSAFPDLAALARNGDGPDAQRRFGRLAATAVRTVILLGALGGALLAGTAQPVARVFVLGPGGGDTRSLAWALLAFAPAVPALGVVTLAGRVLNAGGRHRLSAAGTALGWLTVAACAVVVSGMVDASLVAATLGAATSAGLALGGALLLLGVARACGRAAVRGLTRVVIAGTVAGVIAGGAGAAVGRGFAGSSLTPAVLGALLSGLVVVAVFVGVAAVVDRPDARAALARLRSRSRGTEGAAAGDDAA